MAVQSSLRSPLAAVTPAPGEDEDQLATVQSDQQAQAEDEEAPEDETGPIAQALIDQIDDINLARYIDQDKLDQLGMAVVEEFHLDENSRADWVDKCERAMKFATQETEPKSFPWPGASSMIFPLISQAALQFGSIAYPALIQNRSVVKGVVWGSDQGTPMTVDGEPDGQPIMQPPQMGPNGQPAGQPMPVWLSAPGEKRKRADKIGEHMSYQLLEEMPEWEPQTDQLLHQIPVTGGAARKTYYDPAEKRNYSLFVSLMNLVWDYNAPSFEAAPRHSEVLRYYPHEILTMERTGAEDDDGEGMFLHLEYGPGGDDTGQRINFSEEATSSGQSDPDAPHVFVEQHRREDLDGDGYPEPVIVTVHLRSSKVVRIVARYDEDGIHTTESGEIVRIQPADHYTLIPFLPNLEGGSYPMGFAHLLKPLNEAINTTLNQMFDAGTLQNAGGGFISSDMSMASGQVNFQVGKYQRVTTRGQSIKDSVFPLPFQGPSATLFQLLGVLISAGKDLASIQNVLTGDAAMANAPPTTVLALIEQGMKVYSAIHKRIYRAFKSEFQKLYRLNRLHLTEIQRYRIGDEWREITPEDYRLGGGVEPIADPTMTTDMQRLGRAQILMASIDDPTLNRREILRRNFEAANIDRVDELFAPPDPMAQFQQQFVMAKAQAELGRERAAELKDQTQAFLNMANARKVAGAQDEAFIEAQLGFLRLKIEALNTSVKAAAVDHKFHDTRMRTTTEHAKLLAAQDMQPPPSATPTPAPTGAFPVGTDAAMPPPGAAPPGLPEGLPAREFGGPVEAGQPYVVGEAGPEVIVPEYDGMVHPNPLTLLGGIQREPTGPIDAEPGAPISPLPTTPAMPFPAVTPGYERPSFQRPADQTFTRADPARTPATEIAALGNRIRPR